MANAFDNLLNAGSNDLVQDDGSTYTFVDADTIRDQEGKTYRLKGVDAPETTKLIGDGRIKSGTKGGELTSDLIDLAKANGFTNVVKLGTTGAYNREEFDLQDKSGRSFSNQLIKQGVLKTTPFAGEQGVLASEFGAFQRASKDYKGNTDWDTARDQLQTALEDTRAFDQKFKQTQDYEGQREQLIRQAKLYKEQGNDRLAELYNIQANKLFEHGATFDYKDRDSKGNSLNPLSDSLDQGLMGVTEALWGITNLVGETAGFDYLKDIGEAGVTRARSRIADKPFTIVDYKDVNGIGDALEYLGNNAALSLPYMAITLTASVAAPFTFGASLTAPAAVYAGQTWNEQEGKNKNAAIAITSGVIQAALDRLGLKGIISTSGVSKKVLNEAAEKLAARDGISLAVAKGRVVSATKKEIAGFADNAAAFAQQQIKARNLLKNGLARIAKGATSEGITEMMQETVGYFAAHQDDVINGTWNANELSDRLINAGLAGTTLGGGFSVAGAAANAGAWAHTASALREAESDKLSEQGKFAEQEIQQHGRISSIQELNDQLDQETTAREPEKDFHSRVKGEKKRQKKLTTGEWLAETMMSAPKLWRGATRFIFTPELQNSSRAARILADTFGGNLQRTFSGSNFEGRKHHLVTQYKNMVPIPQNLYNVMSGNKVLTNAQKAEISDKVYSTIRNAINQDGTLNLRRIPRNTPHRQVIIDMAKKMQVLSDQMHSDQKKYNPDLGYIKNYLARYKSFDKGAINKNKPAFQNLIMQEFGKTHAEAAAITDSILGNENVNTIDEAFSVTKGGIVPGSHQKRTLNLSENPRFQEFMEKNIFTNISNASKSAARYVAYQEFIGKDSKKLNERLQQMEDELTQSHGEATAKQLTNKVAKQMQDYLDAESGNYKRPTTEAGRNLEKIQRNLMLWTTMAGLPLATISSFVEAALTLRGLTNTQIFGKDKGIHNLGKELAHTLYKGMGEISGLATRNTVKAGPSKGQQIIQDIGYMQWEVGAATTTGVSETNPWQRDFYEKFFKWTGLQGWTNYTRAVRASIFADYFTDKVNIIKDHQGPKTNEVQEAEEALRNLGINVNDVVAAFNGDLTPEQYEQVMNQNIREGTFNFVNDAVALPQSANRPLIYQDPRFALFTQFQGFIATFTANHIPKLWGEYVKRGTPAMKYNAFALMTTMIMLGFASQYLKDLIKYGEASPYLTDAEKTRRAIGASGLLGTGERVLDQFFPLYEKRSNNPGDWLFNTTTGESPALGSLTRAVGAAGDIVTGDVGRGLKGGAKALPIFGPLNFVGDALKDFGDDWNFQ